MDTVTHAMTGLIFASPFAVSHPFAAGCIAIGSVLPDLDALSRIFGKHAFLRCHQTVTHGLPAIFGYAVFGSMLAWSFTDERWYTGLGLAGGALLHILLDLSNTYGIALFSPWSARRFCMEWVFFIDAVFIAGCVFCLTLLGRDLMQTGLMESSPIVAGFILLASGYFALRVLLRRLAIRRAGYIVKAMVPSALWPWVWYGYAAQGDSVQLIRVDLFFGVTREVVQTFDDEYAEVLDQSNAYHVMSELSAGYQATDANPVGEMTMISCRDLRVRNFGGKFGRLELRIDAAGHLSSEVLHV